MQKILITGGSGFIGSCFVQRWLEKKNIDLVNFDALTYAGHLVSLGEAAENPRYTFIHADLRSAADVEQAISEHRPSMILHLAAETHVDRSIEKPADFISTNVTGTSILLEATLHYWRTLSASEQEGFRFLHISTDEVYGPVGGKRVATEGDALRPHITLCRLQSSSGSHRPLVSANVWFTGDDRPSDPTIMVPGSFLRN